MGGLGVSSAEMVARLSSGMLNSIVEIGKISFSFNSSSNVVFR